MDIPHVWTKRPKWSATHAHRLENWLGKDFVERLSASMRGFRHPVPILNVPGAVCAVDGEFIGRISGGGFASLSDLIDEATTGGKKQPLLYYQKVGVAKPAAGASQSLWGVGNVPAAGSAPAAPGAGTVFDRNSTGAIKQANAAGGDTLHFINAVEIANVAQGNALMLADKLWGVLINHATTANTITGVPLRYQTATTAPGNFLNGRVSTALGATAHNITVTYVDQDGNAAQAGSAQAIRVSSAVQTTPFTQPKWFYELSSPDTGLRNCTSIALSAASSGQVDWSIFHAIAIMPHVPSANLPFMVDGINTAFNLERIYDDACLSLIELFGSATAAATYTGWITVCSG